MPPNEQPAGRSHRRSTGRAFLRLTIGLAIVAWLLSRMNLGQLRDALNTGLDNWPWLVVGVGVLFVSLMSCMARWQRLLTAQAIRLPFTTVLRIFFIGQFFNLFMIGATGGDLVKAFLVARTVGGRKTEAVSTVLIDRAIGLTALAWLAGIGVLARAGPFWNHERLRPVGLIILGFACLTVVLIGGLFGRDWLAHPRFAGRGILPSSAIRIEQVMRRVYEAFFVCRRDPGLLVHTFALSFANHLLAVVACMAFGYALSLPLGTADYLVYIPIIGVFGVIPITPGGLGVREGMAVILLTVAGVTRSEAMLLSLLLYFGMMFWSLLGGIFFVFKRWPSKTTLIDNVDALAAQELDLD